MSLSQDVILAASARSQQEYYGKKKARAKAAAKRKRAPKGTAACGTAPWNKLVPESEMKLFMCASVKETLYRLECAEYEAKYGK